MSFKIVFTDYDYTSIDIEKEVLSTLDAEIISMQTKDEKKLVSSLSDADAVIVQYAKITPKVFDSMSKCKVISRYGIGVDMIDIKYATSKKVLVCNVPDYCADEVSDHAMALIFALARKIVKLNDSVKKGIWDAVEVSVGPMFKLKKQILGIVGFGKIPQNLYLKAKPIFNNIIVFDPYIVKETIDKYNINLVTFYNLLRNADIITIHCPLTDETRYLFDKNQFYLMKKTSLLVNTSRGPIINTASLYFALKDSLISGAALDVLEKEPPGIDSEILKLDNTIITPHSAFYSEESLLELKRITALNVLKVLKGEEPINVVNKNILK